MVPSLKLKTAFMSVCSYRFRGPVVAQQDVSESQIVGGPQGVGMVMAELLGTGAVQLGREFPSGRVVPAADGKFDAEPVCERTEVVRISSASARRGVQYVGT